jgi:hypothetical protein
VERGGLAARASARGAKDASSIPGAAQDFSS